MTSFFLLLLAFASPDWPHTCPCSFADVPYYDVHYLPSSQITTVWGWKASCRLALAAGLQRVWCEHSPAPKNGVWPAPSPIYIIYIYIVTIVLMAILVIYLFSCDSYKVLHWPRAVRSTYKSSWDRPVGSLEPTPHSGDPNDWVSFWA